jgi:hypothetical protein
MAALRLLVGVLGVGLAAAAALAQPPPKLDTSGWPTYRNDTMRFEVKHPTTWRVTLTRGTLESVILSQPSQLGQSPISMQFLVQWKINPEGLSIDRWYADQLRRIKATAPPPTPTTIGGRPALRRDFTGALGRHYDFFTRLDETDIFQVTITQPAAEAQLDPRYEAILSTLRFLD